MHSHSCVQILQPVLTLMGDTTRNVEFGLQKIKTGVKIIQAVRTVNC